MIWRVTFSNLFQPRWENTPITYLHFLFYEILASFWPYREMSPNQQTKKTTKRYKKDVLGNIIDTPLCASGPNNTLKIGRWCVWYHAGQCFVKVDILAPFLWFRGVWSQTPKKTKKISPIILSREAGDAFWDHACECFVKVDRFFFFIFCGKSRHSRNTGRHGPKSL